MKKNETNHPPAPWIIDQTTLYRGEEMIKDYKGQYVAAICERHNGKIYDNNQTTANAKLIESAPLILEALQDILREYDKIGDFEGLSDLQDSINILARKVVKEAIL